MNSLQFNAFTTTHKGIAARIITPVSVSLAFDPAQHEQPPHPLYKTTALWDTGATNSVLTQATISALGLTPVGETMVSHAGGSDPSKTYVITFYLPNHVCVPGVLVTACHDNAGNFGAIIGMDIITQGDFSITNINQCTLASYRIPSIQTIDYVVEANRIKFAGVGRNDLCPCGSGKKYKQCHGQKGVKNS